MKTILSFLVIAVMFVVNGFCQTTTTEKQLRPRAPHMPVRQTEIDKELGLKESYSYRASISPTRVSIQEKGERDPRPVYRIAGVNGGKDQVIVQKTVLDEKHSYTNATYYVPQMVDGKTTAKAGTVIGLVPLKPSLPKK